MNDALEKLRHELEVAQRALAEAEARCTRQEAEHQSAIKQAELTRKQIEQAHQQWTSALDAVQAPIFMHDKEFRVVRCNRAYQRYAGIPFERIIGQLYYEVFPKTHAPLPNCLRAMEAATDADDEELTIDGKTYRAHAVTIRDEQGAYRYSMHGLEDITERKSDEANLKLFRALLDRSSDAIEVVDLETLRFIDGNETACRVLGYSREELLSMGVQDVDSDVDDLQLKAIPEALRTDGSVMFESRHRRKDGSTFPVEVSLSRVEADREYAIAVARDITERKRAEQALLDEKAFSDTLIRSMPGIFFLLDAQGNLVQWNEKLEELLGLSPQALSGIPALTYIHEQDRPRADQAIQQVFATGSAAVEVRMVLAEGIGDYLLTGRRIESRLGINLIGFGIDITERKRAEARLLESERAYRLLAQNLPGMVYRVFVREHGRMGFYNDMTVQLTGYTSDELVSGTVCSIEPLIEDEDRPGVVTEVANAMAEHRSFTVEYQLRHKNGSLRWMREYGMPVYGPDDKPLYTDGVIFDVTASKQAEEHLKLFRTLIDLSSDFIEVVDPSTFQFLDINETECRVLGYSREEMLTMSVFDINPTMTPELVREVKEKCRQKGSTIFESVHQRKDGSTFPVEVQVNLVEIDKAYLLNSVRDITERRRVEAELHESSEKFRAIFDHARDGIIVMDIDEPVVKFANRSMEQMLGYGPGELVGLPLPRLHPPEALEKVREQFEHDARGGQSDVQDMPMLTKDGRVLYADLSGSLVDIGGQRYLLGAFRDATERRRTEAGLAEQLEELRRWHDAMLGREQRVLELKHEVNVLLGQNGQRPRYPSAESPDPKEG